ncbi:MAG: glycosyltransferase family 2 protein, partial [Nitrososphaerales archaeon]
MRRFADTVIALDDGSTDDTASILASSDLVSVLLSNPRRETYRGWDDSANRNRLLAATATIRPHWIMQLDADERLDVTEALALRHFVERTAERGFGYSFRIIRMIDDCRHWDLGETWVARLFAFEPGQSFQTQRLHGRQVPTSIPPRRTFRTTLRIQHLAGLTRTHREARFRKYMEADPYSGYHQNYKTLLEEPNVVHEWAPRPPGLPIVFNGCGERLEITPPGMTTVVIARDDADTIAGSLQALEDEGHGIDLEIVVVVSGSAPTAAAARCALPYADVVELEEPVLPGEARNIGLARAKGSVVSFPGSHVLVRRGSLAIRLAAHRRGYAMVTGTI